MTHKHFERLAQVMRVNRPAPGTERYAQWLDIAVDLTSELRCMNPNFDHRRFTAACLGEDK